MMKNIYSLIMFADTICLLSVSSFSTRVLYGTVVPHFCIAFWKQRLYEQEFCVAQVPHAKIREAVFS